jgi:hypothetical protein
MPSEKGSIGQHAYQLWLDRGCPEGTAEQDWLDAERQLRAAQPSSQTSQAVDDSLKNTFPASDPPATQIPDAPPSNAEEKWKAAGISRKTSSRGGATARTKQVKNPTEDRK